MTHNLLTWLSELVDFKVRCIISQQTPIAEDKIIGIISIEVAQQPPRLISVLFWYGQYIVWNTCNHTDVDGHSNTENCGDTVLCAAEYFQHKWNRICIIYICDVVCYVFSIVVCLTHSACIHAVDLWKQYTLNPGNIKYNNYAHLNSSVHVSKSKGRKLCCIWPRNQTCATLKRSQDCHIC